MHRTLQDLVKTLESLPPDDRQTHIDDFLALIDGEELTTSTQPQPASLQEVYEGAVQQITTGQTLSMKEFCDRAQALNAKPKSIPV